MSNNKIDKINEILSNSWICESIVDGRDSIKIVFIHDESLGKSEYLYISAGYKEQYESVINEIYTKANIKSTYILKTVDDSFYKLLYSLKKANREFTNSDFSRFIQNLINKKTIKYEIFHKVWGLTITDDNPVQLEDFRLCNYKLHKEKICEITAIENKDILLTETFKEFREHDTWISCVVEAKELEKAKELAYEKFELFQSTVRFLASEEACIFYFGILNDKVCGIDDFYAFSEKNKSHNSVATEGRGADFNLNFLLYRYGDLLRAILEKICTKNKNQIERRICNSLIWFGRAEQETLPEQKLTLYVMAIEALLEITKEDIAEQLAEYISTIFSKTKEHKKVIYSNFKRIYHSRSSVVHGSEVYINNKIVETAKKYSRSLIFQFFVNDELKEIKSTEDLKKYISGKVIE